MPATVGTLDPGFHSGSPVAVDFIYNPNQPDDPPPVSADDKARAVAIDGSGNILAAGMLDSQPFTNNGVGASLVRLTPDGTPDPGFGSRGPGEEFVFQNGIGADAETDDFTSIARDRDGAIAITDPNQIQNPKKYLYMAGYSADPGDLGPDNTTFMLGKFLASDGEPQFALRYPFQKIVGHKTIDRADAVLAQPDGTLLLGGWSLDPPTDIRHAALARVHPDGLLDTTFGADDPDDPDNTGLKLGIQWLDLGLASATIAAMAFQSDGRIILVGAGHVNDPDPDQFLVVRLNADDTLDTSFGTPGTPGKVLIPFAGAASAAARALAIEPGTDRIIVAGSANFANRKNDFALAALSADGKQLDPTFGSSGKVTTDFQQQDDFLNGLALQPDGAIVAVGETQSTTTIGGDPIVGHSVALARYLPNGLPDSDFGPDGSNRILYNVNGTSNEVANAVAIQKDGKIVVAGWSDANYAVSHVDYFVARFIGQTPKLTNLDPAPATAGTPFTLTVQGTGFVKNSVILVNGQALTTQFISSTSLSASISATNLPTAGQATIAVQNPGAITSRSTILTVNPAPPPVNVAPTVNAGNDAAIDEAATFTGSGFFADPDPDTWTATVNYGDGSGDQPLMLKADKTFGLSHVYVDNGSFTVTVKVTDNHGAAHSDTLTVTVKNLPPTATLVAPANVNEGSQFTVSFNGPIDPSASDAAAGFTYAFDRGDGTGYGGFGAASSVLIPAIADGTLTIRAKIRDKDGGESEFVAPVTVVNVAPAVVAGGNANLLVGQSLSRVGSFTDPGADSWSARVDYGDGGGFVSLPLNAAKTFSLDHTYSRSGTFTVVVRVEDGDGGSDTRQFNVVVSPRPDTTPPRVVSFKTTQKQGALGTIQIKFSEAMTVKGVASFGSYQLVSAGPDKRFKTKDDRTIALKVVYDPVKRIATLTPKTRVALNQPLQLTVRSAAPIVDLAQNRLDGDGNGKPGGDYIGSFGTKPRK